MRPRGIELNVHERETPGGERQELAEVLRVTPRHVDDRRVDRHLLACC